MTRLAVLYGLVLLAGCAGQSPQRTPAPAATVNLSGYPSQFREGYKDGCSSARGTRLRNEARFQNDPQYAGGWRDGFDICSRQR